jgi:hypothetical protein
LELEALWGPTSLTGISGALTIGAATVDGSLCLTQTTRACPDGLLEAMRETLAEICSGDRVGEKSASD